MKGLFLIYGLDCRLIWKKKKPCGAGSSVNCCQEKTSAFHLWKAFWLWSSPCWLPSIFLQERQPGRANLHSLCQRSTSRAKASIQFGSSVDTVPAFTWNPDRLSGPPPLAGRRKQKRRCVHKASRAPYKPRCSKQVHPSRGLVTGTLEASC